MPIFRTIKREWKTILGGGFFLVVLALFFRDLYFAWAYGTVRSLPLLPTVYLLYCNLATDGRCLPIPSDWISLTTHPTLFFVNLGVLIVLTIVVATVVFLFVWGWRREQRYLIRHESRPPLDNAIRESTDR